MLGCCSPRVQASHSANKWQWYNLNRDMSALFSPSKLPLLHSSTYSFSRTIVVKCLVSRWNC